MILQANDISVMFSGRVVLDRFSLDLNEGQQCALTERSGSGKTTLLLILAGLLGPSPDNVLLVPPAEFTALTPGATVIHQFHVRLDHHSLPSDPAQAADTVSQRANNFTTTVAGGALVGDNLNAALAAAREDALYARMLVLLLGIPGLVLSGVVTALVISLRNDRQRRDLALLRLRGATPHWVTVLVGVVALVDGLLGAALGLLGALVANRLALGAGSGLSPTWLAAGGVAGVALALLTELTPVARLLRGASPTVNDQVALAASTRTPLALRLGLDVLLLAGSGLVFWLASRGGYQVVVVPEGVPVVSVNYAALLAPALAWPGMALLIWRLTALALARRTRTPDIDAAGTMRDLRRHVVRRRRHVIARGATGLAVGIAVTVSAAVFTTTYDQQRGWTPHSRSAPTSPSPCRTRPPHWTRRSLNSLVSWRSSASPIASPTSGRTTNTSYLNAATGSAAVQTLLIRTDTPAAVAARIHAPAGALVNDITAPKVAVPSASGLAAGSLAGLARLTFAFGLLLAAASAGLVLIVGAAQRRRSLVALAVIGATARQRARYLWTEARWITVAGTLGGVVTGALIAMELIKVLNGIFDPAPPHPFAPWGFLSVVLATVAATSVIATVTSARWAGRIDASRLRDP